MELVLPETCDKEGKGKKRNCTCIICGAQTPWFCLGCHHHYCITISNKRRKMVAEEVVGDDAALYLRLGKEEKQDGGESMEVVGLKSCFWVKHTSSLQATAITGAMNLDASGRYDDDDGETQQRASDDDSDDPRSVHSNLQQPSENEEENGKSDSDSSGEAA